MFQTTEHNKTPEEELSKMEMGNLPKKESSIVIVKMIRTQEKNGCKERELRSLQQSQKI